MYRALYERPAHVNRTDDVAVFPGLTPDTVLAVIIAPDLEIRGDALCRGNKVLGTWIARTEDVLPEMSGLLELLPPSTPLTEVSRLAQQHDY